MKWVKEVVMISTGIFMDNSSARFMTDLVFNSGNYGMFLGNRQFTACNVTFNVCNTAIS
jgi:glucan 1,3-beta-glucosidase